VLSIRNLTVSYGAITALQGISFDVAPGEIVTLIGSNGAGKTTTLRAISGLVKARGSILYQGRDIAGRPPHERVAAGISHVPEGRMIFANLTVAENLDMGAFLQRNKAGIEERRQFVFGMFPRLAERRRQVAGTLSGGEQQMLAIGRALMSNPEFLMLDEPSLGLAPLLVNTIFEKIAELNRRHGLAILLVEQNANFALAISSRGCVLEAGQIILRDSSAALRENPRVRAAYLGGQSA